MSDSTADPTLCSGLSGPIVLQTAYEVIRPLQGGGMSNLWLVRDLGCNRLAVLKTTTSDLNADPVAIDRFRAENRILARLSHPNIVQLYGIFSLNQKRTMIMELVEGVTLSEYQKENNVPLETALDIIRQILSALNYAHSLGVTHRDIKPTNVMITGQGQIKLLDFGISKCAKEPDRTFPGTTMGSLYYMSPEQITGSEVDTRSDIYSLGILFYELLTGQRPFHSTTSWGVMEQHLKVTPEPPEKWNAAIPAAISRLILKAIAKKPADRFQSAKDFVTALDAACVRTQEPVSRASTKWYRTRVRLRITIPSWLRSTYRKPIEVFNCGGPAVDGATSDSVFHTMRAPSAISEASLAK